MTDLGDLLDIVQPGKHEPGRQKCAGCPRTAAIRRMTRGPDGRLYGSGCARKRGYIRPRAASLRLPALKLVKIQPVREKSAMSQPATSLSRRFVVERNADPTGISNLGTVLDGVLWPDGTVSVRWRGDDRSFVSWDSIEAAERKHCYGGHSRIVWIDPPADQVAEVTGPPALGVPLAGEPAELAEPAGPPASVDVVPPATLL